MELSVVEPLVELLDQARTAESRFVVSISGPPGAGKSTLAGLLHTAMVERHDKNTSAILPMDGFHLDNDILDARGHRARKGAPHTFDIAGLINVVSRVRQADSDVYVPVFDREQDLSRAGARVILSSQKLILVEGNYLLLQQPGWRELYALFDYRISMEVAPAVLRKRLIQRWLDHDHAPAEAKARAESNDLPNAQLVVDDSRTADCIVRTDHADQTTLVMDSAASSSTAET
ncbi:MAG: nucleoside/nucleotide kinase family protein [Gammaproteobacteria bacterium]|nr:nucleoside/nucleotide kinase family protein [Gammaproteobacteria bacterium]